MEDIQILQEKLSAEAEPYETAYLTILDLQKRQFHVPQSDTKYCVPSFL